MSGELTDISDDLRRHRALEKHRRVMYGTAHNAKHGKVMRPRLLNVTHSRFVLVSPLGTRRAVSPLGIRRAVSLFHLPVSVGSCVTLLFAGGEASA